MDQPVQFVRAQVLQQTIERQIMSCISLCARMTESSTITGEQVRLVRTLLQKSGTNDVELDVFDLDTFIPRVFDSDKCNAEIGSNNVQTKTERQGLGRILNLEKDSTPQAWDSGQWELPGFLHYAETQRKPSKGASDNDAAASHDKSVTKTASGFKRLECADSA